MREAASFIARQHSPVDAGVLPTLLHLGRQAFRSWHNRRKVANLSEFDDHLLCDIGISRSDIRQALDLPFAQDPALELQRLALRNRKRGWSI